jgi:hypothetical protein
VVVEGNEAFRRSIVRFLKTDRIVGWDYFAGVDQKPDANGPPDKSKSSTAIPTPSSLEDFLGSEMLAATEQMLGRYEAHQVRIKSLAEQLGVQPSQKPPELKDQLKPPQEQ